MGYDSYEVAFEIANFYHRSFAKMNVPSLNIFGAEFGANMVWKLACNSVQNRRIKRVF